MKPKKGKGKNTKTVPVKKPREPFKPNAIEWTLFGMVGISLVAVILAYILQQQIITYILLANYLFLGVMLLVRPTMFIEMMRKNRDDYDDQYEKKEHYVLISLRVAGAVLVGVGVFIGYELFF